MSKYLIVTGTVTYAMKARDILNQHGFNAKIERVSSETKGVGCGYTVVINRDLDYALRLLKSHQVKVINVIYE